MSSSSESDVEESTTAVSDPQRLGKCEVCDANDAKYTCPKCEVKTCRLECVNIHKRELDCDGIRDRTKFIRIRDFKTSDLLSDYRLLEECARFVYAKKRDEKKRFTRIDKELPVHLYKLKTAARNRGTALQFLTQNFVRHKQNTTFYDWKTNIISWRVEWVFANATPEPVKYVDERCAETERLTKLLEKYVSPTERIEGHGKLEYYHAAGFNGMKVLLKAEKVPGSSRKYFELDPAESLGDNLAGKCIVEYPVICVVLRDHAVNFDIVSSDDELDEEVESKEEKKENLESHINPNKEETNGGQIQNNSQDQIHNQATQKYNSQNGFNRPYNRRGGPHRNNRFDRNRKRNENRELVTEKFAKEKKLELRKEIKAERKKKPKNLLFTTGYSSDESISDCDDDKDVKLSTK